MSTNRVCIVTKEQLAASLNSTVLGLVNIGEANGISESLALYISNQAEKAYIRGSRPSLFDLYQSSQNRLERLGNTQSQINAREVARDELKVTFEQQMMLNQHFEPSKLFLTFGMSGIHGPQHKGDKGSIDIPEIKE